MKKVTYLVSLIFVFLGIIMVVSATAFGFLGGRCEFDAVGCDAFNDFNGPKENAVVANAKDSVGNLINHNSYWPIDGDKDYGEYFYTNQGRLKYSPCQESSSKHYALADVLSDGEYEWRIMLQMIPTSDIELEINECSLKHNESDVWKYATQNGWYRLPYSGDLIFENDYNVKISVEALPGPLASNEFKEAGSFIMDARAMPGLDLVSLDNIPITSIGFWGSNLMMALPQEGLVNSSGQVMHTLNQGDQIKVKIAIYEKNTTDLWYGADSIILKYKGAVGTEFITEESCEETEPSITVTYPNGGEELVAGTENKIKWKSEGVISTVSLGYSVNNGLDWIYFGSGKPTGSYLWKVPDTVSTECLIRISNPDNINISDNSDNTFAIVPHPDYSILEFFDESVANGTLEGNGPGKSANRRLNALRNMLEMAVDLINIGDIEGACDQLKAALRKCDNKRKPPDFVSGPAASELYIMITELMTELGCE